MLSLIPYFQYNNDNIFIKKNKYGRFLIYKNEFIKKYIYYKYGCTYSLRDIFPG
jgi:hypothetical protein